MKNILFLIFSISFFSLNLNAQNKEYRNTKIDKQVFKINKIKTLKAYKVPEYELEKLKKYGEDERISVLKEGTKIIKIEYYSNQGHLGSYRAINIYLKKGTPIFFEKEYKRVIDARLTNGRHEIHERLVKYKVYIKDWDKWIFDYLTWNKITNEYDYIKDKTPMNEITKIEILEILELSKTAIVQNREQ